MKAAWASLARLIALLLLSALALQVYFLARIAVMRHIDPQSTSFQRSEAWRLLTTNGKILWSQQWSNYARISEHLKRAVIASEDAGFSDHSGIEWDALEQAFERNQRAQERADRINQSLERRAGGAPGRTIAPARPVQAKLVGGSTITQQLAKNVFLSGERNVARKAQELLITLMFEALLDKQRILEIYLNSVEWGEGLFGAQAAARHYFHVDAARLSVQQAAQLAVMLPAPKRFEKRPYSPYVLSRAATVAARMDSVELP
jgi:monofunctional biosynthetic peptidoglycan transglycosylase